MLQGKPKGGPTRTPGTRNGTAQATVGWPGIQSPAIGAAAQANPTPLPKVNFALLDLERRTTMPTPADMGSAHSTAPACVARPSSGPVAAFPADEDTDPNVVTVEVTDRFETRLEPMLPPRPNARGRRRRARAFAVLWVVVACASFFWFADRPRPGSVRTALPSESPSAPPSTNAGESAPPADARLGATDRSPQPEARASNAGLVSRRASAAPPASRKRAGRVTHKKAKHMSRAHAARAKRKHKRSAH